MKNSILFVGLLLMMKIGVAQPSFPYLQNFTQKEYGKEINPETYCIAQDSNGVIYAGTAKGIITYNGTNWGFIDLNIGGTYVSSIDIDKQGKIYIGAFNNFGYLERNTKNEYVYTSISDSLTGFIGNIYKTYCVENEVYFQSESSVFIYSKEKEKEKVKIVKAETSFHLSFRHQNGIVAREREKGLFFINNNEKKFFLGSEIFANTGIFGVLEVGDSTKFLTYEDGIWNYNLTNDTFLFSNIASQMKTAYGIVALNKNKFAVNTLENGVFILENDKVIENYSRVNGLKTNDVKQIIFGKFGNLWLATNNGISVINYSSPFSYYGEKEGLTGNVEAIAQDGKCVGTSDGFFYKENKLYKKTQIHSQVWAIKQRDKIILIATIEGLYSFDIDTKKTSLLLNGTFNSIENIDNGKVILAGSNGVFILNKKNQIEKEIALPLGKTTTIALDKKNNEIWVGTQGMGVVRIFKDFSYDIYDDLDGLNIAWVNPLLVDSNLFFGNPSGLQYFVREETIKEILPDSLKNDPMNYRGYFDVANIYNHNMTESINAITKVGTKTFVNINDHLAYFNHQEKDELFSKIFNTVDFGRINTFYSAKTELLIGCSDGLILVNTKKLNLLKESFNTSIDKISLKKDSIISINFTDQLEYKFNTLKFQFSAPFYEGNHKVQFSHFLVGEEEDWSKWSFDNKINFSNLGEGNYTLKIKAKNIFEKESSISEFTFTILPPWYRTIWAYLFYFVLLICIIYGVVKISLKRLKAQNEALEKVVQERTKEVVLQKEIIEHKHNEITASINYAARIQLAVLTSEEYLDSMLNDYFVLFKPRDIVSGDFYWAYESIENDKLIWVAADCTGHGVPGGFMSMMGMSFLNEIIIENRNTQPDIILNLLRSKIIKGFEKKTGDTERKDGMDISLCVLNKITLELQFAGAYNPLYLVRETAKVTADLKENENYRILEEEEWSLIEVKASKMPIGKHILDEKPFELSLFQLMENDRLYTFSDGFADQFGGPKGKKYMSKRFKKTLLSIQKDTMKVQKNKLDILFIDWMKEGKTEQIDDLCVMGVHI